MKYQIKLFLLFSLLFILCFILIIRNGCSICSGCLVWQNDYEIEGEEIVRCFHCSNCGADVKYFIKNNK